MAKGNRPLRGGVGNAPAGRGGIPDQLFAAREGIPIRDQIARAAAGMSEDEALPNPPTPQNRAAETFDTVRESLASSLGVNFRDNAKRKDLQNTVDSMLQLIAEGDPARIPAEEVERYGQVVRAYQDAFNLQTPQQKALILKLVPESQRAGFEQFYGGNFANEALRQTAVQQAAPGVRELLAQETERLGDQEQYLEDIGASRRDPGSFRPYNRTPEGREMNSILWSLIDDYGIPPETVNQAMIGDAALEPFNPGPGVNLTRESAPVAERLSTYIGDVANQGSMRYRGGEDAVNEGWLGRELLDQYRAGAAQADMANRPFTPSIIFGNEQFIEKPTPDMILTSSDLNDTDPTVRLQMTPEIVKVRDELHNRAFGFPTRSEGIMRGDTGSMKLEDATQVETPMDLDRLAPWIDGTTQQAINGRVVRAGFLAEQIVDTMLNQSGFAAEAPFVRQAAKERLLPQVEYAIQRRREAGIEPTVQYNRNAAGMRMLQDQGAIEPTPAAAPPPKPPATGGMNMDDIINSLRRKSGPKPNDMGFADPTGMPRYMAPAMPNRMLAGLLG